MWNFRRTSVTQTGPPSPPAIASAPIATFIPTAENKTPAPEERPEGMVWIPGGEFSMGAQDPPDMNEVGMQAARDSRPIHRVYVDAFWMDKTDVTNEEFARFVQATIVVFTKNRSPRLYSIKPKQGGVFFESTFANELGPLTFLQLEFGLVLRRPIETTLMSGHETAPGPLPGILAA
jgi:formylglycine-generating enzyme required for sulfatase activity